MNGLSDLTDHVLELLVMCRNPVGRLRRIAHSSMLPGYGSTIDALKAVCAEPTDENIALALHIASRAQILLEQKVDKLLDMQGI